MSVHLLLNLLNELGGGGGQAIKCMQIILSFYCNELMMLDCISKEASVRAKQFSFFNKNII